MQAGLRSDSVWLGPRQDCRSYWIRIAQYTCWIANPMIDRRCFLQASLAAPALAAGTASLPVYRTVTPFSKSKNPGMPGPYPGQVVKVHAERSVDDGTHAVDTAVVRQMVAAGMTALTGDRDPRDSWRRFFSPKDVVGIKLNCSGAPQIMSRPEVVAEIVQNLTAVGIAPAQI